jgi:hypothetical protein
MEKLSALILYYTGKDPDEMSDDEFWRTWCRLEYALEKTGHMREA